MNINQLASELDTSYTKVFSLIDFLELNQVSKSSGSFKKIFSENSKLTYELISELLREREVTATVIADLKRKVVQLKSQNPDLVSEFQKMRHELSLISGRY